MKDGDNDWLADNAICLNVVKVSTIAACKVSELCHISEPWPGTYLASDAIVLTGA
jgi:hypothetical protein